MSGYTWMLPKGNRYEQYISSMVFVMIKIYMFFMEGEDKYCRMADMGVSRTKWGIAGKINNFFFNSTSGF